MKFEGKLNSKQPALGLSIFAIMTQLANETGAINLSQGFPDFDCHPELIELVYKHMKNGHNQYAPMPGVPELREALCDKIKKTTGMAYDVQKEITITAGATEAIYAAITAIVHPRDEVIIFEPSYEIYNPAVRYCGGKPVLIKLEAPEFKIDWNEVKARVNSKTRAIILNTPHNPGTGVLTQEDIASLSRITTNTDIILICDEVYEHIIFDGLEHRSLSRYPQLAVRSFVISSFGKTYHATGWKVGYCLAPENLMSEFRKIHQFITYSVNTPIQLAYAEFLQQKSLYNELADFYQNKRDLFTGLMSGSQFKLIPAQGTYFQLANYSEISDLPEFEFAKHITKKHGVAAIPVSVFYDVPFEQKIVRFCFAKRDETLEKAAERLCRI